MAAIRKKGKRLNAYVKNYIVFDLETTGIRQGLDEIVEISALSVMDGNVTAEYSTLVRPGICIPPAATAVNGITDDMVKDAPEISEAMEGFLHFIKDGILVGHNIHTFDTNFIYDAAMEAFQHEIKNDYVDTLYLARQCLPELKHHKLQDVSQHFNINTAGAHRALNDCIMNQKCYEELGKILIKQKENQPELICPKCGAVMVKRKGKFGEFYGCSGFPDCRHTKRV